jgi:hypothetical protein
MGGGSSIDGITIYYPNQPTSGSAPIPYPFAILGSVGVSISNVFLPNAYQGIDLASNSSTNGQHTVRGIYGTPLLVGIDVDRSNDVGRISDIHFWPAFSGNNWSAWTLANGVAIRLGRCDEEFIHDVFAMSYAKGFQLNSSTRTQGATYGVFDNISFDTVDVGVEANATSMLGVQISNYHFTSGGGSYHHAVWGRPSGAIAQINVINGSFSGNITNAILWNNTGIVSLSGSRMMEWYSAGTYAVEIDSGRAIIQDNFFSDNFWGNGNASVKSTSGILVGSGADRVILSGNQMTGNTIFISNALTLNQGNQM